MTDFVHKHVNAERSQGGLPIVHSGAPSEQAARRRASYVESGRDWAESAPNTNAWRRANPSTAMPFSGYAPPAVHEVLRSPGQPLDAGVRAFMEGRFGEDFSGVRIHTDPRAAASAREVDANAYTVGRHIVFGEGRYAPGLPSGDRLLAHELAHVSQAGERGILHRDGPAGGGPSVSMPSITTLLFQYGGGSLRVDLPTSVTATLPVALRGVGLLTFSLNADIPNNFSFTVTLDTRQHLRIATRLSYNRQTGQASAGLVIQTTQTTCALPDAATVQRDLQAAGDRLTTAIRNFLNPPQTPPAAGGEGPALPPEIDRARELGTAIYDLYDKAQRASARCVTRPVWSFEFGAQFPLGPGAGATPPPTGGPGALPPPTFFGGSATFHF